MRTSVHGDGALPEDLDAALAHYRHRIFIEQLGWRLPCADGRFERDQYDRDDTVYVVAHDESGSICGCARLLPTTEPYLLQELFPTLLADGIEPPKAAAVWELSRFAAGTSDGMAGEDTGAWAVRPMLAAVVECAAKRGVRQLIGVTFLSMERLFRRIGVHAHRAGPAQRVDGRMVVACWIDLDVQTLTALGVDPSLLAQQDCNALARAAYA
ncbi:MAG: acyl-homoserine-lactone synthase [Trinickia sp.]|uniref:acyl-homoserine-lactone synthase n=1 Tax=Trinickia sp. TaxID=2571163 RepID=UPI003F81B3F9